MSEVYARNRKQTKRQFIITARKLVAEVAKFATKEKLMPKKYRIAFGYDLIKIGVEMINNIMFANAIYPTNEAELARRKMYQEQAIANLFQIHSQLLLILECCNDTVKVKNLNQIIPLLRDELKLLIGWKKANKICKAQNE